MRTLIIEDDATMAMLLTLMLEDMGMEVCGSEDTENGAIEAVDTCRPDLMIVDVNLKVGSGIDAVNKIQSTRHIPYVFVSADLAQIKSRKPNAVMLQKPYAYVQLADAIRRAMAQVPGVVNQSA